jgi:hypothetical protein
MTWTTECRYKEVEQFVLILAASMSVKYLHLTDLMLEFGADLGMPHTNAMSDGLFEFRKKELRYCQDFLLHHGGQAHCYAARVCKENTEDAY